MTEKINIEKQNEQAEIAPEIDSILQAHVVNLKPEQAGRRELLKKIGDAAIGVMEAKVARTDPSLDIASAVLEKGKAKVLIGPNGAGKTTFFDAVMDREADFDTKAGRGAVVINKPVHIREKLRVARLDQEELLGKVNDFKAREILQSAADHFKAEFPVHWENSDALEANLKNQQTQVRIETLVDQIVGLFDMEEFLDTRVKNLSGGERTKLALFMVLLSEPDLLLLNEPTNHLDLQIISKLTALFNEYKKAGIAIVSVSHVDWFLRDAGADGVLEITWNKSKRVLDGSPAPYEKYMKNPTRERVPIVDGEIEWAQKDYGYKIGEILIDTPPKFTISNSPLENISIPNVHGGELMILSGNNGTGKTKLMEVMARSREPGLPSRERGVNIAYLPQFWPEEIAKGTLWDFFDWIKISTDSFMKGSAYHPENPPEKYFIKRANDVSFGGASRLGDTWLQRPLQKFSGGEQRLLWFLAASALRNLDMLALDEPTNHMDRFSQEKVARAIQSFPGAILLSTHDRTLLNALTADGGKVQGARRFSRHMVLEKIRGKTTATESRENPAEYMERIMREAVQKARRFKI